jgi:Leucine-rich repeat (LRR) protein
VPDQIQNIRQQVLTNAQQRGFVTDQLRLSLECYTFGAAQAQSNQDNALRKLASKLKAQIPTMPEGDVDAIRAWFVGPANQPAIQAVTQIDLSYQQLTVIPPEIGALVNLRVLNLLYNQISEIPAEIGALVNLKMLNLHNNQVPSTSDTIPDMKARGVYIGI